MLGITFVLFNRSVKHTNRHRNILRNLTLRSRAGTTIRRVIAKTWNAFRDQIVQQVPEDYDLGGN